MSTIVKMTKNLFVLFLLVAILVIPSLTYASNGDVNWNENTISAIGIGVMPASASSVAQGKAMARRAAIVDAYRNLAEITSGVKVEGNTTVQNYIVVSDVVKTSVAAMINNAKIMNEQGFADGSYQVTLQINLYGDNSVASALVPQIVSKQVSSFPVASPAYQLPTSQSLYTGVIVDARGLGLERVMCPRIYDESGRVIYGNMYVDPNIIVNKGMVDYDTVSDVGSSRAGTSPIIVKAISLRDFDSNVIISNADGEKILSANARDKFLLKTSVIFQQ